MCINDDDDDDVADINLWWNRIQIYLSIVLSWYVDESVMLEPKY